MTELGMDGFDAPLATVDMFVFEAGIFTGPILTKLNFGLLLFQSFGTGPEVFPKFRLVVSTDVIGV